MEITLSNQDSDQIKNLFESVKNWCKEHQVAVGIIEMAVGAGVIAYALQNGLIDEASHVISALRDPLFNNSSKIGAAVGGTIGAIGGSILGSIGVVALGGAIGIPALVVTGGASAIMALAGYSAGDLLHNFMNTIDYQAIALNGSLFLVGLGLLIDGARRCLKSSELGKAIYSRLVDSTITLAKISCAVVASTTEQVVALAKKALKAHGGAVGGGITASVLTAALSSFYAPVTFLGSKALGGVALATGVVSAPAVLPIALAAGAAGYAAILVKNRFFS